MHFELERANRVGDFFDVVAKRVRPIVHRINAPFISGAMV